MLNKNVVKARSNLLKVVTQIAIFVKGLNKNLEPEPVFGLKLQARRLLAQVAVEANGGLVLVFTAVVIAIACLFSLPVGKAVKLFLPAVGRLVCALGFGLGDGASATSSSSSNGLSRTKSSSSWRSSRFERVSSRMACCSCGVSESCRLVLVVRVIFIPTGNPYILKCSPR